MNRTLFDELWQKNPPQQSKDELLWLINKVEMLNPKVILEIGIAECGTLQYWWELIKDGGHLICIDPEPKKLLNDEKGNIPKNIHFIQGYSESLHTIKMVEDILNKTPIDFIHVDGDHLLPHLDYENYIKYLRNGGIMAFHDMNNYLVGGVTNYLLELYGWDREYNFTSAKSQEQWQGIGLMWKNKTGKFNIIGEKYPHWYRLFLENNGEKSPEITDKFKYKM